MSQQVSFGAYRFDVDTARLWTGAREVRLTLKASAVLRELVTHAGAPVSKDELFATVWSGTAVTDDALTSCVGELRRAFADDPRQPRFIETRHRRGYQFCAPVVAVQDSQAVEATALDRAAIAVLPFSDMSPARDQHDLCDGLVEELINVLTQVAGLRVTSRLASFQCGTPGTEVRAIGLRLSAGTLLIGSVRKAGDRLRVTVQAIDASSGRQTWSQRFDRTLDDVFAIQDEIAESVATSIRRTVLARNTTSVAGADDPAPTRHTRLWDAPRWPRAS